METDLPKSGVSLEAAKDIKLSSNGLASSTEQENKAKQSQPSASNLASNETQQEQPPTDPKPPSGPVLDEAKQRLQETKRLSWDQANEDRISEMCGIKPELPLQPYLFTCGRCKSNKTTSTQKKTDSAGETPVTFVLCLNCGKRWKC